MVCKLSRSKDSRSLVLKAQGNGAPREARQEIQKREMLLKIRELVRIFPKQELVSNVLERVLLLFKRTALYALNHGANNTSHAMKPSGKKPYLISGKEPS